MPRRPRIIIPGWVHHVTQRGNYRQTVFFADQDRIVYLRMLAKYLHKWEIRLIGYCLMGNHIHLAVIPQSESSLSEGMAQVDHDFALWQNMQRNRTGHLWQNRFYSAPVEEAGIWEVLAYVELNPVRAGIVEHAWDWPWSSAHAHVTGNDPSGMLDMEFWSKAFSGEKWKDFLKQSRTNESTIAKIRYATRMGYFLGSEETARKLENELGKLLLPNKRGRKAWSKTEPSKLGEI
jgi:putative transposase